MNLIDLHVHTIASGHGISTLNEIVQAAKEKGIKAIGITDHGPQAHDGPSEAYFYILGLRVPEIINNVRIFKGIEANILDYHGNVDIPHTLIPHLDIVLVYMHPITRYKDLGIKKNTRTIMNAFNKNPAIDILAHPVTVWYPIEIKTVIREACTRGIALELNEASFKYRKLDKKKVDLFIEQTMINNGKFVISSDAHMASEVGNDETVREIIAEYGISDRFILNKNLEDTMAFIAERKKFKQ